MVGSTSNSSRMWCFAFCTSEPPPPRYLSYKTFPTMAAAKSWRSDTTRDVRRGTMKAPTSITLRQAWDAWLTGARNGTIRTRSGDTFKPSTTHGYEQSMNARVLDDYGAVRLSELTRNDLQDLASRLLADGLDPSTALMPLRAIFRRAVSRGEVAVNPTTGLELPAVRGRRDRIVSPAQAAKLLAALQDEDRALWATALYAGLRRGELLALRWEDVDLPVGVVRVERAYDPVARVFVSPKSRAGTRTVPVPTVLREHLAAQRLRTGRAHGLAFSTDPDTPFDYLRVTRRAQSAWKEAELDPIGLHEARHTFASLMIAAGVNAKALATYMGHSSITITLDRYGHLFQGNEGEAAKLLNEYLLDQATGAGSGADGR